MRTIIAGGAFAVALALGGCASMGHDMGAMHQPGAQHDCEQMHQERHQNGQECECCEHQTGAVEAEHAAHCEHRRGEAHGSAGPAHQH